MSLMTFSEAIDESSIYNKRHLLLGNGFSIACCPSIFHYNSLFKQADFSQTPEITKVFEALGTQDFEIAIKALESTAKISLAYMPHGSEEITMMRKHASKLKEILIQTIAKNHPATPSEISDEKFWACRRFLSYFLSGSGQVFTLNYDLLLYWTLMHEDNPFSDLISLTKNDGFGNDEHDPNADYVVWQGETRSHDARVHYLHGAIHLFDSGSELKKYTWNRSGIPLIEQARQAIKENSYPLFVSEGASNQKKNKIRHNAYLYQGFKQLSSNSETQNHCFFTFGHSLAINDDHILQRLSRGKFKKLYVSIFGDHNSKENTDIMNKARGLAAHRHPKFPLEVAFYESGSAKVWGD